MWREELLHLAQRFAGGCYQPYAHRTVGLLPHLCGIQIHERLSYLPKDC